MSLPLADIKENFPMSLLCTTGVGGTARYVVFIKNRADLLEILSWCKKLSLPFTVVGGGSNILMQDEDYDGLVIRMMTQELDVFEDEHCMYVGAGVSISDLIKKCAEYGFAGIEDLNGVPGTVGAGIFGNAGAHNHDFAAIVTSVDVLTSSGDIIVVSGDDLWFEYRTSCFKRDGLGVILGAYLQFCPQDHSIIQSRMKEVYTKKYGTQPMGKTCGSYFKNPPGHSAWKLIDECGLRGFTIGGAQVSEMHSNFLVNAGGATRHDFDMLEEHIKKKVLEKHGVTMVREIRKMGVDF